MLSMDISFSTRQAIERLRDGLFDSVAMDRLTMEEETIKKNFSNGLKALEKNISDHLCICGSYGQGKSHMLTYLHQQALAQGYATSFVQLDLREIPFHQFSVVYHSLMKKLRLPDGARFIRAWKKWGNKHSLDRLNTMPHRFQMILRAILNKKYPSKESPYLLEKALMGHDIPTTNLKKILKYQEIEGYQKQSLACRGNLPYFQMVQALGHLLQEMGYKGLVLFFDEAESITQAGLGQRAKSYDILDHFFKNKDPIYPIFALTDDFFAKVDNERYDDEKKRFLQNYAEDWKDLNILRLQDFSSGAWETLQNRLIQLYGEAYQIDLSNHLIGIKEKLHNLLQKLKDQETRFKLKALVNQLDIETQHLWLLH
jgi:P-loop Domain of unknown function (DUF2791)